MKKVVIAALVTASVAGAGFAVARNHGGMGGNDKPCMRADGMHKMKARGGMHKGKRMGMRGGMFRGLDLTQAQQKQLQAIYANQPDTRQANRQKHMELAQKKRALIQSKTFDTVAFEKLMTEQDQLRKTQRLAQAQRHHKAWQVLTPKQQAQVQERMDMMHKRKAERMQTMAK